MPVNNQSVRKVLMTADTVGGVWTYALDLCRAFKAYDIRVVLATMGAPLSASQWREAESVGIDVRESNYKLEWMDSPSHDVTSAGEWLLQLEQEICPDIIHLNGYVHAALNWNAPVIIAAHSCVLSWWQAVKGGPAPDHWGEYKKLVTAGLHAADAVVAISGTYADDIAWLYGLFKDDIKVIYNGRDTGSFHAADKKQQLFAMGRIWDEAKNLSLLGKLQNKNKLPLLLAGDNRHPETGAPTAIPNVTMLGKLTPVEVRNELASSLIYALPALYEPFGLSVLEAALSGCVLLLSDIPTFRELWGETALYFDPRNATELDQLIDYALAHPEQCKNLAKRSRARAQWFSLQKMAGSYISLYNSLVDAKIPAEVTGDNYS